MPRTANDAGFWDCIARKYSADAIADPAGYERTWQYLKAGDAVLEFGGGTGTSALKLAPAVARFVATDMSSEMIAIAWEKAGAECCANIVFDVARADAADWPDGTFDVVLGFNVLHAVAARDAVLQNVCRLLKPGGLFISKTPWLAQMGLLLNVAVPVMQAFGKASYVAFFSDADMERTISAANFEIAERARHGSGSKNTRPFLVAQKGTA